MKVRWLPEPTDKDLLRWIGRPDPVIVEIGCADGRDTKTFLRLFPQCRVWCFEPDARPLRRFRRDIHDPRVALIAKAVSDVDGMVPWFASHGKPPTKPPWGEWAPELAEDWDLSSSMKQPTGHLEYSKWVTFSEGREKPSIRLDTWLKECQTVNLIDFMWMDVQGAEREVISAGNETFRRTALIYTEFYDKALCGWPLEDLYRGQPGLDEILSLLPGFSVASFHHGWNVLLENTGGA